MIPVAIWTSGHRHNAVVSEAFLAGCGAAGVRAQLCRPGSPDAELGRVNVFYGFLRGLLPPLQAAQKHASWIYLDNGYWRPSDHMSGRYDGHYRATLGRFQHTGVASGPALHRGEPRWRALGLEVTPARRGHLQRQGCHVLVCPPTQAFADGPGFQAADWLNLTMARLDAATDRPLRVRAKGSPVALADDLADCHAVVTWGSSVAFHALLAGIPVVCDRACAAFPLSWGRLDDIDDAAPPSPAEVTAWAQTLAANQWTLAEMRSGQCWRELGL